MITPQTPVYLAGSWTHRAGLRVVRDQLESLGIPCTSSWLDIDDDSCPDLEMWAYLDLEDIDRAHTLIVDTSVPSTSGGYWWECGYALGMGMPVIGVGPKTNLFCSLISDWAPGWPELVAAIAPQEIRDAHTR